MKMIQKVTAAFLGLGLVFALGCGGGAAAEGGEKAKDPTAAGGAKDGYGYEFIPDKVSNTDKTPPPEPTAKSSPEVMKGRLPPEEIQKVVRANFDKLRGCYDEALKKDAKLAGKLVIKFVIKTDGTTEGVAKDEGTTIADAAMVECSLSAIKGIQFPRPEGGIVTVVYPIEYSP